jgi:TPR repeat protein
VPKSYADAAKWYRKAAEQNVASAQNSLGWMHIRGQGVAKDAIEAATWFKKAAEGGYAKAQVNLGEMLFRGEYFASDWVEAYKWFMIAASRGDKEAQRNRDRLGQMMSFDKIDEARTRAQAYLQTATSPQK